MLNQFMQNLYHGAMNKTFNFYQNYMNINKFYNQIYVVYQGKLLANKEKLDSICVLNKNNIQNLSHQDYILLPVPMLERSGLSLIKFKNDIITTDIKHLNNFRIMLLEQKISWCNEYLLMLKNHFSHRSYENTLLINLNSIQIEMGRIITIITRLQESIQLATQNISLSLKNSLIETTSEQISKVTLGLFRLAGGRAFLQSNIIEMHHVFSLIRAVYFAKGVT